MNFFGVSLFIILVVSYFIWRRKVNGAALALGLKEGSNEPVLNISELAKQVDFRSGWFDTEDLIYVARCGFDTGRAAFSFPGNIVVGEIRPVACQLVALTDEALRVYGQGFPAAGKVLSDNNLNIVVFDEESDIRSFSDFVARWNKKVSIEIVDSLMVVLCGWRPEDIQFAIQIIRDYRAMESESL